MACDLNPLSDTDGHLSAGPSYTQPAASKARAPDAGGQLWVQKHKPQKMADLIGNPSIIATIRDWLANW